MARRAHLATVTMGLILLVAFVVPRPLWATPPSGPPPPDQPLAANLGWPGALLAIGFALLLGLGFRPYSVALNAVEARTSPRLLGALTAGLALVALLIYPTYGSDIFMYIAYARQWAVYGENPLLAYPAMHPADWSYAFAWARLQPSPYGPLWALITWPLASIGRDSPIVSVLTYKVLALAGYVGCCVLLWSTAPAHRRGHALVFFAWSPLVLFDVLGKVHNDILLALAALAAVRLSTAGGVVVGVLGGLIKASGLALVPSLLADALRQRRHRAALAGFALAVLLLVLAYLPFWAGPATLGPITVQTNRVVWSPGSLLIAAGVDASLTRALLATIWLTVSALVLMRVRDLATSAALMLLATMLLLTTAFFAHYLVPVIALAALGPSRELRAAVTALSIGSLVAYATELFAPALEPGWIGSASYQVLGSLITLGPLLGWAASSGLPHLASPSGRPRPSAESPAPPR